MAETLTISEREKRLWGQLKGDILNVALAGAANTPGMTREASKYLLETVGAIVAERERTVLSVLRSSDPKEKRNG